MKGYLRLTSDPVTLKVKCDNKGCHYDSDTDSFRLDKKFNGLHYKEKCQICNGTGYRDRTVQVDCIVTFTHNLRLISILPGKAGYETEFEAVTDIIEKYPYEDWTHNLVKVIKDQES